MKSYFNVFAFLFIGVIASAIATNNYVSADDPVPPQPKPEPLPVVVVVDPTLTLPKDLKGVVGQFIEVPAKTNGKTVKWKIMDDETGLNLFPIDLLKDTKTAVVVANRDGIFHLHAWTALNDIPSDLETCTITIGNPVPVPPVPPQPIPPGPNPPQPNPPAPVKLSVLFIDENSNYGTASYKSYEQIVNSVALRGYLNSHCAVDSTTGIPSWRKWDQNTDITNESNTTLKKLFAAQRSNLPWLVISDSNGNILSSTSVPNSLADTMTLLQKFGGQ